MGLQLFWLDFNGLLGFDTTVRQEKVGWDQSEERRPSETTYRLEVGVETNRV